MVGERQKPKESPDNTAADEILRSDGGARCRGQLALLLFLLFCVERVSATRPCTVGERSKLQREDDVANVNVVKKSARLCVRLR